MLAQVAGVYVVVKDIAHEIADFVFGETTDEKVDIASRVCHKLLKKIRSDLQHGGLIVMLNERGYIIGNIIIIVYQTSYSCSCVCERI